MKHLILFLFAATLVSCASSDSTGPSTSAAATAAGLSYATAIVVPATNEMVALKFEYAYIRAHYPGSKFMYQALGSHGDKPYDIMTFKTVDGKQRTLYFDISRSFERF